MMKTKKSKGFTLIELMIVVAIIGILAAIAIPKFADLVTKSKEATAKGSLGSLRSAISIYYGDLEGLYPVNIYSNLAMGNKYLPPLGGTSSLGRYEIPTHAGNTVAHIGGVFANANAVAAWVGGAAGSDLTPLVYNSVDGAVIIGCTHSDTRNQVWSTY